MYKSLGNANYTVTRAGGSARRNISLSKSKTAQQTVAVQDMQGVIIDGKNYNPDSTSFQALTA